MKLTMYNICNECNMLLKYLDKVTMNANFCQQVGLDNRTNNGIWVSSKRRAYFDDRLAEEEIFFACPECGSSLCDSEKTALAILQGKKISSEDYDDICFDAPLKQRKRVLE